MGWCFILEMGYLLLRAISLIFRNFSFLFKLGFLVQGSFFFENMAVSNFSLSTDFPL